MSEEKAEPTPLLAMAEKIHEHAHRGCLHEPEPISEMEMALAEVMLNLEANPNFEVSMSVAEPPAAGAETVEIDRDYLDILFWLAAKGDVAMSKRNLKHGFRKHAVCSGDERHPDCPTCQAFTAAGQVLGHG